MNVKFVRIKSNEKRNFFSLFFPFFENGDIINFPLFKLGEIYPYKIIPKQTSEYTSRK